MPNIPKRAIEEAALRLLESGFSDRSNLNRVARAALLTPLEVLESFGCKVTWPRIIPRRSGRIGLSPEVLRKAREVHNA